MEIIKKYFFKILIFFWHHLIFLGAANYFLTYLLSAK